MASLNTSTSPGGPSPARPIEQLLVMHCLKEDNVLGRDGFGVRAVSPGAGDRATLDWAMRLDAYELPLDMKSGTLLTNQAPRRLSLVPGPSGQWALIHSAYLPEDTAGRPHSFISQVLLLPEVSTAEAVAAWGASDWWTDGYPRGDSKSLPALDEIPRGALLDDAILSDFLSGAPGPADQSLARSVFPGRVESNPQARRRWVRAALHAFLLTADANSPRTRVCILAEPGAVALLVYAIARLLPPQLVSSFAFSTYEPPHTSLRENKVARVIGSYARNGIDRAESDSLRRRGYVVDTFRDAYGPDLLIEPSWPLEGLLDYAAQGDWAAVDEVREIWSRDARVAQGATPVTLSEAVRLRPLAAALRAGTIGTDGLIELWRNRFGEGLLGDPAARRVAWATVRKVWSRPGILAEFADLLREHVDELVEEVRVQAQSGRPGTWREGWEVLKRIVPPDRHARDYASIVEAMGKGQAAASTSPEDRIAMLGEWARLAPRDAATDPIHWLLKAPDAASFRALAKSKLEPRLVGLSACLVLAGGDPGPGLLRELAEDQFHAMVAGLMSFPQKDVVHARLRSSPEMAKAVVDRLLQVRSKLEPAQVEDLLWGIRCDEALGHGYWLQDRHLEGLLDFLARDSLVSRGLWRGLIARITRENFSTSEVAGEMESMAAARAKFPISMEAGDRDRLDGWNAIRLHFAAPSKPAAPGAAARLRKACEAIGQTPEALAQQWFARWVVTAPGDLERKKRTETLSHVLLGFYGSENAAWDAARRLASGAADDVQRRMYEADFRGAILSQDAPPSLGAKDAGTSVATVSAPNLKGGPGRGIGRRTIRLEMWKPYAVGSLFTVLLILLLWMPIRVVYDSLSAEGGSKPVAKIDEADTKIRDLEALLLQSKKDLGGVAQREADIKAHAKQLVERETAVGRREAALVEREVALKKALAGPAPGGQAPPVNGPPSSAGQGGNGVARVEGQGTPESEKGAASVENAAVEDLKALRKVVRDVPLKSEGFPAALAQAQRLDGKPLEASQAAFVLSVKDLLTGLAAHNVSIEKLVPPTVDLTKNDYRSNFYFLASGEASHLLLAAIRPPAPGSAKYNARPVSFYFLSAVPGLHTTRPVATLSQYDFLAATESGQSFILAKSDRLTDGVTDSWQIDSSRFYGDNKGKRDKFQTALPGPRLSLTIDQSDMKLAISNDGKKVALARPQSSSGPYPSVEVFELTNDTEPKTGSAQPKPQLNGGVPTPAGAQGDPRQNLVEFNPAVLRLEPDSRISSISFDYRGSTLVGVIENKPYLLALGVGPDKARYRLIGYPNSIRDSALSVDGKLAIVTDFSVYSDNLSQLRDGGTLNSRVLPSSCSSSHLRCVAFGPRGTIMATGDEAGAVSIRLLGKPHDGYEVLRLAHVGPVLKVGFSQDGRILAALARPRDQSVDTSAGVIRLWVNEGWEPNDGREWSAPRGRKDVNK